MGLKFIKPIKLLPPGVETFMKEDGKTTTAGQKSNFKTKIHTGEIRGMRHKSNNVALFSLEFPDLRSTGG